MSRWFRHYAGLCRDDKLVGVAIKSKQPVERVVWVWCAILESAAEIDDAGRYKLDAAEIAYFLRTDEADIRAIEDALCAADRVAEGCVVKWGNRQFQSDRSRERVAAFRERKRSEDVRPDNIETSRNGDVTLQKRYGNAPETETETERSDDASRATPASIALAKIEPVCLAIVSGTSWPVETAQDWHALTRLAVDEGLDVETEILPAIRQQSERARQSGKRIGTWGYFANGCREFARQARSPPQPLAPHAPTTNTGQRHDRTAPTPMQRALDALKPRGERPIGSSDGRTINGEYKASAH